MPFISDTLLNLVDQAAGEMGLSVPPSVIGSAVAQTQQYLYLINGAGRMLSREYDWQALLIEYRFTTQFLQTTGTVTDGSAVVTGIPSTAGLSAAWQPLGVGINQDTYIQSVDSGTQVTLTQAATASGAAEQITFCQSKYTLPSAYDRMVDNTQWDKDKHWILLGPETQQQVEWLKSGYIATGPRIRYYIMGNTLQLWPPISSNEYLGLNYVSQNWVTSAVATAAGTGPDKSKFTIDTDTCIFPSELMVLALKLKLFEIKGFDTTAIYRDFTDQKNIAKANDAGSPTLSMAPTPSDILIGWENVPDSGIGM